MSDYGNPIDINKYLYRKPVYYTNPLVTYQEDLIVKLILDENNFNFDLAKEDGSDFRLMEYKTGIGVLHTWVAYWNNTIKRAVLFFKIPSIGGGASVTFTAYWGNPDAESVSDPDVLGALFCEDFSSTPLSSSKWSGEINESISDYGYYLPTGGNEYFISTTNPLNGISSWIIECGLYPDFDETGYWDSGDATMQIGVVGTENDFTIRVMHNDRIEHNAVVAGQASWQQETETYGGLEGYCYQELFISYYELEDKITVKLLNRETFDDVAYEINRKVEGDTRPNNIEVFGRQTSSYASGAYPCYISWLMVREYNGISLSELDGSSLYIPYETVNHQNQDFREYSDDITNIQQKHETSFGGNPYLLSEGGYDSDSNIWISNNEAIAEDYVALTVHTAWGDDVSSTQYIHFDSGHEYYYNASKLSDEDEDRMGRTYWGCTTTSGWAAIKFDSAKRIGAFMIKATDTAAANPKNFKFLGSNYNPMSFFNQTKTLVSGTFNQTTEWQASVFNALPKYKYYILDVQNTYGNDNIEIQEWQMMDFVGAVERKYVSQLRLHPAIYGDLAYNFPKEVTLQGSLNGYNWTTIMPWTNTYTPFVKHITEYGYWQRYSFDNIKGYWSFRLLCRGNWGASDGKIIIGEWSLHELASELYTYRILQGTTNNISQMWAAESCRLDDVNSVFFLTNDKLNKITNNKIMSSENLPSEYIDFNVI